MDHDTLNFILDLYRGLCKSYPGEWSNYSTPIDWVQDYLQEKQDNEGLIQVEKNALDKINAIIAEVK